MKPKEHRGALAGLIWMAKTIPMYVHEPFTSEDKLAAVLLVDVTKLWPDCPKDASQEFSDLIARETFLWRLTCVAKDIEGEECGEEGSNVCTNARKFYQGMLKEIDFIEH